MGFNAIGFIPPGINIAPVNPASYAVFPANRIAPDRQSSMRWVRRGTHARGASHPQDASFNLKPKANSFLSALGLSSILPPSSATSRTGAIDNSRMRREPASAAALDPGWIDAIDWRAFDEVAFFNSSGVQVDQHTGFFGRLHALYDYFQPPAKTNKLPLDITQFDNNRVARFVHELMKAIRPGEEPYGPVDPAFAQNLFKRWFLQLAAPADGHRANDRHASPFDALLLNEIRPNATHIDHDSDSAGPASVPALPRIGALKNKLREIYHNDRAARVRLGPASLWEFDGLCQIYEPTLIRKDLPKSFRYGSLAWVLLSIGIDLAGDSHADITSQQLIALATATVPALFSPTSIAAGDPALRQQTLHAIVRMAQAQGKLDPLKKRALTQRDIEIALNLFQSQLLAKKELPEPIRQLIGGLPTRSDTAKDLLRERGFLPEQLYTITLPIVPHHGVMSGYAPGLSVCRSSTGKYLLYEILMRNCIEELRSSSAFHQIRENSPGAQMPEHDDLTSRFETDFDKAFKRLSQEILVPALQDQIDSTHAEAAQFWQHGQWTVRIPSALFNMGYADNGFHHGGIGSMQASSATREYRAQDSVLIRLTLGTGRQLRTRRYWARLKPFKLHRYTRSDRSLLNTNFHHFFQQDMTEDMTILDAPRGLTYEDYAIVNSNNNGNLLQTISTVLLQGRVAELRESARETTAPEAFRADAQEMLLNLIPLRACAKSIHDKQYADTQLYCTLDALSLIPAASAGTGLSRAMFALGRGLTKNQIGEIASAFLTRSMTPAMAHRAAPAVLELSKPAVNLVKEGVRLLDPGIELLHGLSALPFRLGAGTWRLVQKLDGIAELPRIVEKMQKVKELAQKVHQDGGFWRVQADLVISFDAQRYAVFGDKKYRVFTIGDVDNVLAIGHGADFRLVNPHSGIGYGPALRAGIAPGQLALAPVPVNRLKAGSGSARFIPDGWWSDSKTVCRSKRAGDMPPEICQLIATDTRFGELGYVRRNVAPRNVYQFRLTDAAFPQSQFDVTPPPGVNDLQSRLRAVDMTDIGYVLTAEIGQHEMGVVPRSLPALQDMIGRFDGQGLALHFPEKIKATIVHLSQPGSETGADFIVHTAPYRENAGLNTKIYTTRYVPFGTYQDFNGRAVNIVYFDADTAYSFDLKPSQIPLAQHERAVVLKRADDVEIRKYRLYQGLLHFKNHLGRPGLTNIVKLRDAPEDLHGKFIQVFARSMAILDTAIAVMRHQPSIANFLCMKMTGWRPDNPKLAALTSIISQRLIAIQATMPYVKQQSPHIIGFFDNPPMEDEVRELGNSISFLTDKLEFRHMPCPLIVIEKKHLMQDGIDAPAATLIHELSHLLTGTEDFTGPDTGQSVYAHTASGNVNLLPIIRSAAAPGSNLERHAATFEHITMLLSYLANPKTTKIAEDFLRNKNGYVYADRQPCPIVLTHRNDLRPAIVPDPEQP